MVRIPSGEGIRSLAVHDCERPPPQHPTVYPNAGEYLQGVRHHAESVFRRRSAGRCRAGSVFARLVCALARAEDIDSFPDAGASKVKKQKRRLLPEATAFRVSIKCRHTEEAVSFETASFILRGC